VIAVRAWLGRYVTWCHDLERRRGALNVERDGILDLHDLIAATCRGLGCEPNNVALIEWVPGSVRAVVYKTNSKGQKYIGNDGEPEQYEIRVRAIT